MPPCMECSSTLKVSGGKNVGSIVAQSNLVRPGGAAMVAVAVIADLWGRGGLAPLLVRQAPVQVGSRTLAGGRDREPERGGDRQDAAGVLAGCAPDRSWVQAGRGHPRLWRVVRERAAGRFLR